MKKTIAVIAVAMLLVVGSVLGTLAYLTSTATVQNTFTVGNIYFGDNQEAGLDEALTNENGEPMKRETKGDTVTDTVVNDKRQATRVTRNTYKLQPGHTYTKDPTIHVGDTSDDCYLFVKVENGIANIEDSSNTIASQMAAKGWKALGNNYENIYVYVGTEAGRTTPKAVSKGSDVVVFEKFKVAETVSDLSSYANANITVTAYGVQVDGFESKTATQIWGTAFASQVAVDPSEPEPGSND